MRHAEERAGARTQRLRIPRTYGPFCKQQASRAERLGCARDSSRVSRVLNCVEDNDQGRRFEELRFRPCGRFYKCEYSLGRVGCGDTVKEVGGNGYVPMSFKPVLRTFRGYHAVQDESASRGLFDQMRPLRDYPALARDAALLASSPDFLQKGISNARNELDSPSSITMFSSAYLASFDERGGSPLRFRWCSRWGIF